MIYQEKILNTVLLLKEVCCFSNIHLIEYREDKCEVMTFNLHGDIELECQTFLQTKVFFPMQKKKQFSAALVIVYHFTLT